MNSSDMGSVPGPFAYGSNDIGSSCFTGKVVTPLSVLSWNFNRWARPVGLSLKTAGEGTPLRTPADGTAVTAPTLSLAQEGGDQWERLPATVGEARMKSASLAGAQSRHTSLSGRSVVRLPVCRLRPVGETLGRVLLI